MFLKNIKFLILKSKLRKIKLVLMDFDGVLTDGGIFLSNDHFTLRRFDVQDGLGIKQLQKASINIGCITGSNSNIVKKRCQHLNIKIVETGIKDKLESLLKIQRELSLKRDQILFLGDDINDLTVFNYVKLFFAPFNAHKAVKRKASYVSSLKGGYGFIREITDLILISKGNDPYNEFKSRNEYSDELFFLKIIVSI